ncbi:YihY/virulence factor BrkB family protein [soil metagenome]
MNLVDRVRRIGSEAIGDNITGEAAKAAYYFFLSLFPMILVLFGATSMVGGEAAFDRIMSWLDTALPDAATSQLEAVVRDVTRDRRPDALSLGILLTLWAASNFFAALGDGLDVIFGVHDRSSWLRKRGKAVLLMFVGGTLLMAAALALVAGPQIAGIIGLSPVAHWLAWPIVFVMLVALFWLIYYILPAHDQSSMRKELFVGAVVGTVLWILAAIIFRFYVSNIADFERMYGFIGGIIVLLLWLYITSLAILLGGEVAHVVADERAGSTTTIHVEPGPRSLRENTG